MNNDEQIISLFKDEGSKNKAFGILVSTYKKPLYWHIRKIVINHDDADDVIQNTFIKIYKNLSDFKGDSKLYSWLYRIATNEAISFINKRAKEKNIPLDDVYSSISHSLENDELYNGDMIQKTLRQAILKLPKKQQLVFNMKYFDEMKYNEISEILDTSVGALKASYHHAVKKIELFIKDI